jgi:hypothetical protein
LVFIYLYFGSAGSTSFRRTLPIPISKNLFADGCAYGGTDGAVNAVYDARVGIVNSTTIEGICYAVPSSGGVITVDCGFRAFVIGKI